MYKPSLGNLSTQKGVNAAMNKLRNIKSRPLYIPTNENRARSQMRRSTGRPTTPTPTPVYTPTPIPTPTINPFTVKPRLPPRAHVTSVNTPRSTTSTSSSIFFAPSNSSRATTPATTPAASPRSTTTTSEKKTGLFGLWGGKRRKTHRKNNRKNNRKNKSRKH